MNIDLQILTKPEKNIDDEIKILSNKDVIKLNEVQAITNAVKEHLLFIGLDRGNNVRNISLLGIGTNYEIAIDSKDIIRTALFSCSDRVILVHNHPSNKLEPSYPDIHLTNITNQILKVFNIKLLDHIIVTENDYVSMEKLKKINRDYTNETINNMSKGFLIEENERLKKQIEELKGQKKEKDFEFEMDI